MFKDIWIRFKERHPTVAQFLVFFILSNGITVLQLILMPALRVAFAGSPLETIPFQVFPVGSNLDGSRYYIFNYAPGAVAPDGSCGGLAYFLAVQITLLIAQIINFFAQRSITFKSNGSILKAAFWYFIAYVVITLAAAALQGIYKAPLYHFFMGAAGNTGEKVADIVTMIINSAISFWVFFPIFKIIFKNKPEVVEGA